MSLNRVQELEARYDGRIPPDELAWAHEQDRKHPLATIIQLPARATPPRFATSAQLIEAMAAEMVRRLAASGACTDRDLAAAGFTTADQEQFGERARTMAADRMAPRQLAYETYEPARRRGGRPGPKRTRA